MTTPFSWLGYDGVEPRGRWDSNLIVELLAGSIWRPPGWVDFTEIDANDRPGQGRVILFPAGPYVERGSEHRAVGRLSRYLKSLDWSLLVALSDECALFPWQDVKLPETCKLWVQMPKPERAYPIGTRFLPLGPPPTPKVKPSEPRVYDVYFGGQVTHERRWEMWDALSPLVGGDLDVLLEDTGGFLQGRERDDYLAHLRATWIAPAPSGPCTQDSFRLYEALDAGCIPIVDKFRPDGEGEGYWDDVFPRLWGVACVMSTWGPVPGILPLMLERRHFDAATIGAHWQQLKRRIAYDLQHDCAEFDFTQPSDQITVLVLTSPVPSNPDLSMIQETIASVRERLPHAEILIGCDGVRPEQEHRRADYEIFLHELCMWANTEHNVVPFVHDQYLHQSGLMRALLPEVPTPYILLMEQDAPLVGEIPFDAVLSAMQADDLNSMRFYHDNIEALHQGSAHLFPLLKSGTVRGSSACPWQPTLQFSARPHVARTNWYRHLMDTFFTAESRTFVEDVLHGPAQHGVVDDGGSVTARKQSQDVWIGWRMAVYWPDGEIKRSTHLDGRGDDPKYSIVVRYPGDQPEGAMPPGEYLA